MFRKIFAATFFIFAVTPAYATQDCASIQDPTARLACFDKLYPRQAEPVPAPEVDEAPPQTTREIKEEVITTPAPQSASEPTEVVTKKSPKPEKSDEKKPKRGFWVFGGGEKEEYKGTITDLLNSDKKRMVFQLDNGQIWIQQKARSLRIKKGDKVTIKSATGGGYMMRTDKGVSTRVDPLKDN